jgi:hypothetical protein
VYPFGVLGIQEPQSDTSGGLVCLSSGGLSGRVGNTLEGTARIMLDFFGCTDAMVLDEGYDVFFISNPAGDGRSYKYSNEVLLRKVLAFTKERLDRDHEDSLRAARDYTFPNGMKNFPLNKAQPIERTAEQAARADGGQGLRGSNEGVVNPPRFNGSALGKWPMNFWWCNQRRDWDLERPAGVVCSTDRMERLTYRETVGQVRAGDIVIHYRSPNVVALSRARENAKHHPALPLVSGENYGSGWRFRTEYFDLRSPVHKEKFVGSLVGDHEALSGRSERQHSPRVLFPIRLRRHASRLELRGGATARMAVGFGCAKDTQRRVHELQNGRLSGFLAKRRFRRTRAEHRGGASRRPSRNGVVQQPGVGGCVGRESTLRVRPAVQTQWDRGTRRGEAMQADALKIARG